MSRQLNPMLSRLMTVYGAPKETENVTAFMGEYTRAMRDFVDSECELAASQLLAKRKFKTWPTIAECLAALEDARRNMASKRVADAYQAQLAVKRQPVPEKPPTAADRKFVDDCAAGKIDMGACGAALRRVAIAMRAGRGTRKWRSADDAVLMPWEAKHQEAKRWASEYCEMTPLGRQAREEGWEGYLRAYAESYFRNCPPGKTVMAMADWKPPQDVIDCYRGWRARA